MNNGPRFFFEKGDQVTQHRTVVENVLKPLNNHLSIFDNLSDCSNGGARFLALSLIIVIGAEKVFTVQFIVQLKSIYSTNFGLMKLKHINEYYREV